jgi:transcriptional regulator with XRE-family HTH domain
MKKALPPLAQSLRDARAKAGLSQHALAQQSGVARITIANIELGKSPSIRTMTAEKLARSLGMTTSEFMEVGHSAPAASYMTRIDDQLRRYQKGKEGTLLAASAEELRWLRHALSQWGDDGYASETSVLFYLLAYRHRTLKDSLR